MTQHFFIIQAQSMGLYGEIFAIGFIVINSVGKILKEGILKCPHQLAQGLDSDREWVNENVIAATEKIETSNYISTFNNPTELYENIWEIWLEMKKQYENLYCASYIGYPIIMNLFYKCVMKNVESRQMLAPYPLLEIDTSFLMTNYEISPKNNSRFDTEIPYNPLCDAKYYGRLFILARNFLQQKSAGYTSSSNNLCGIDAKSSGLYGHLNKIGSVLNKDDVEIATLNINQTNPNPMDTKVGDTKVGDTKVGDSIWNWINFCNSDTDRRCSFISWCPYPVDFLIFKKAVQVNIEERQLQCPYPIHDLATALYLTGNDPIGNYERNIMMGEIKGNPVGGSRMTVRLFKMCNF